VGIRHNVPEDPGWLGIPDRGAGPFRPESIGLGDERGPYCP
jgi:hypothetical protein